MLKSIHAMTIIYMIIKNSDYSINLGVLQENLRHKNTLMFTCSKKKVNQILNKLMFY